MAYLLRAVCAALTFALLQGLGATAVVDAAPAPTVLHGPLPRPTQPPAVSARWNRFAAAPFVVPPPGVRSAGPPVDTHWTNARTTSGSVRDHVASFRRRNAVNVRHVVAPAPASSLQRGVSPVLAKAPPVRPVRATNGATRTTASVDVTQLNTTGINRWWEYEEGTIPGIGRWMVNLFNQNLIVQVDDMDVRYRGIDLAFRRTYNSFSGHDYQGSDGASVIGQYGKGWTNTFDAHMSSNNCQTHTSTQDAYGNYGYSIYDVDGARYDYCYAADGTLAPPAGMEGTSLYTQDGGDFYWTKKSGTQYRFYAPYYSGQYAAYSGRVFQIYGRNHNNMLEISYAWSNNDSSSSANLSMIYVMTENGAMQATLMFVDVNGQRVLHVLTYPDGHTQVVYNYAADGSLYEVTKPGNGTVTNRYEQYDWVTPTELAILTPRFIQSQITGGAPDGGSRIFYLGGSNNAQVTAVQSYGNVNFTPSDGTGAPLQSGPATGVVAYAYESFSAGSGSTTVLDSDGHEKSTGIDMLGRPTYRNEWTGSQWLQTTESWDAQNNLTVETDPRGNKTSYAYDTNDNTIAVAQPQVTTSAGTFRPTHLLSYDVYNNVVASCDPVATHALGLDWAARPMPPPPGSGLCPLTSTLATRMQWSSANPPASPAVPAEPNGELLSVTTPATAAAPNGYTRTYTYDPSRQGGVDHGLPTAVQASTSFVQKDGTSRQPASNLWYDANGNLVCYGNGSGSWILAYDNLNRLTSAADPDDDQSGRGPCSKTGMQANWNTATTTQYFPDGSIQSAQGPSQRTAGVSTTYAYDPDGDQISETNHHGVATNAYGSQTAAGVTTKWYDGADRLVEVQLPNGNGDEYAVPWRTRYLYDLTGSSSNPQPLTIPGYGAGFHAFGNLAMTQEYLPTNANHAVDSWTTTRASAFDALDRTTQEFAYSPGLTNAYATQNTYDASGQAGLLSSRTTALSESTTYAYDSLGRETAAQYSLPSGSSLPTTPSVQYEYDADGRKTAETSGTFGRRTNTYDAVGNLLSRSAPAYAALPQVNLTYDYYPDNTKADVGLALGPVAQPNFAQTSMQTWSYRADGLRSATQINYPGMSQASLIEYHTPAGRLQIDSNGSTSVLNTYAADGQMDSRTIPATIFSNIAHDAEGSVVAYQAYASIFSPGGTTVRNVLTIRGEALMESYSPDFLGSSLSTPATQSLFGILDRGIWQDSPDNGPVISTYDTRTKVLLSQWDTSHENGAGYTYDAEGRLTSSADGWQFTNGNGMTMDRTGSYTRAYDAENRLVSENASNYNMQAACPGSPPWGTSSGTTGAFTYQWNVDDHPWLVDGLPLIWSDDEPLAQLNANGSVGTVFIDSRAVLKTQYTNPLMILDRDLSGGIASWHDVTGYGYLSTSAAFQTNCSLVGGFLNSYGGNTTNAPGTSTRNITLPISEPRPDGIWDGANTIQGVRAYDSTIAAWTTPDAYKGNVHDPMSQQPYMWNRGNPIVYSDPSGYSPQDTPFGYWFILYPPPFIFWDLVKEDVRTVTNRQASGGARTLAAASIAATLLTGGDGAAASKALRAAVPVGESIMKTDGFHSISAFMRDAAADSGSHFGIIGRDGKPATLTQMAGVVDGVKGTFNYVVDQAGNLVHSNWAKNTAIDGIVH